MGRIKVIRREDSKDLFFNTPDIPEVFFDEIYAYTVEGRLAFFRNGTEFGHATIEDSGGHGGHEYFKIYPRELFPIPIEKERYPEHMWVSMFQEGDELEVSEELYRLIFEKLHNALHPKTVFLYEEEKTKREYYKVKTE